MSTYHLMRGWTAPRSFEEGRMVFPGIRNASGIRLHGTDGKSYMDLKSMLFNVNLGHRIPDINKAVSHQLSRMPYVPNMDGHVNDLSQKYAEQLLSLMPGTMGAVYLSLSGTAAVECAIQVSREYWRLTGRPSKRKVISLKGSYHGASLALSCVSDYSDDNYAYRVDTPDFVQVQRCYCYRCPYSLEPDTCSVACKTAFDTCISQIGKDEIAAIVIETVQGTTGQIPPPEYFEELGRVVRANDILLVVDEVLTGFGRLGPLFSFPHFGLEPDVVCLSKGITNGVAPLAATVFANKVYEEFWAQDREILLGGTQDGNCLGVAAGLATLAYFENRFDPIERAEMGSYLGVALKEQVHGLECVGDIRGMGFLWVLDMVDSPEAKTRFSQMPRLHDLFLDEGVFLFIEDSQVVVAPPVVISRAECDEAVDRIGRALRRFQYTQAR